MDELKKKSAWRRLKKNRRLYTPYSANISIVGICVPSIRLKALRLPPIENRLFQYRQVLWFSQPLNPPFSVLASEEMLCFFTT